TVATDAIAFFLVARESLAHAQITDDDVVGVGEAEGLAAAFEADAVARRGLAGGGQGRFTNLERAFQLDAAADAAGGGARSLGVDGRTQAARAGIVEIGDKEGLAAASTFREGAISFRTGEGARARAERRRGLVRLAIQFMPGSLDVGRLDV